MSEIEERVWPFPILPLAELSERDRITVRFLETAYAEGFGPRVLGGFSCYTAESDAGRVGDIIRRSGPRDWWEVLLSAPDRPRVATGFVFGFDVAAGFVLRWLRGEDEDALWAELSEVATRRWRNNVFIDADDPTRAGT